LVRLFLINVQNRQAPTLPICRPKITA
jgi:hypothetical protein